MQDTRIMTYTVTENKTFLLLFLSFTLALAWKDNTLIWISQAIAKVEEGGAAGNFQTVGFVFKDSHLCLLLETPGPPCDQFPFYSQCHHKPQSTLLEVSYQVQLLQPEHPVPCFFLSLIITVLTQLDMITHINLNILAPSHAHDYLDQMCPFSLKILTNSTSLQDI